MIIQNVIFDLDGTLVDSAPGILATFALAFEACHRTPVVPLETGLIGPPLRDVLARLAGTPDPVVLDDLASAFKAAYDSTGCLKTLPFAGVDTMLRALKAQGRRVFVATNKRATPTGRIIHHLGWSDLFERALSLDSYAPPMADKAALIGELMSRYGLSRAGSLYVGDLDHDGVAASQNQMRFLRVAWGYGGKPASRWTAVDAPEGLGVAIENMEMDTVSG